MGDERNPDGQGGQQPPAGTPPAGGGGDKTFSQADLDRIVAERLSREQKKYADYEELKKSATELKKLQDAQLSETEKRDKRIKDLEAAQADWENKGRAREMEITERLIRAEVRVLASGMGFTNPDDAYALAALGDVKIDDEGNVQGVQKALEKLAKDKPYLVGKGSGAPGSPPNNPKGKGGGGEEEWMAEAQKRYGIRKVAQNG